MSQVWDTAVSQDLPRERLPMIRAIAIGTVAGLALSMAIAYAFICGWPVPILDQDFGSDFS